MKPAFISESGIRMDLLFQTYVNHPALITGDQSLSFSDVAVTLNLVLLNLQKAGVRKGHRVAIHHANSELHLYLFLASWFLDCLYLPLDFKAPLESLLPDRKIDFLVAECPPNSHENDRIIHPKHLLVSSASDESTISRPPAHSTMFARFETSSPLIPFDREASAVFTSGSTGTPRGIVHTVGNYVYSALGTNALIDLESSDRWLLSLPLFHVGGVLIWVRTLIAGCTCILPRPVQNLGSAIKQYHPSVVSLVPAQLIRLLDHDETVCVLKTMKTIMLGGAPSPAWLIEKALNLDLPIMPTYGCTESCAQVSGVIRNSPRKFYFTSGRTAPHRSIRIDNDGVIEIGGKTLFKRYLDEPTVCPLDADGFFKTADRGVIDEDGNLVIHGRVDNTFISGGENISPPEIEKALLAIDGIFTAIVVPVPHREYGMIPWAFVETSLDFDEGRILENLRQKLPGYKLPKRIIELTPNDRKGTMKHSREFLTLLAGRLSEDVSRTELHFEEAGPSHTRTIVFLHGFMGKANVWGKIMERLSDSFRSIAFDLPGHGRSLFFTHPHLRRLHGIEDTARLILQDLDHLGVERFVLYGYSMGGRIAQHIALAAPKRVSCLILESASFGLRDDKERNERLIKDRTLLSHIKTTEQFRNFLQEWYQMPLFKTLAGTRHLQSLIDDKLHHPVEEYQKALNLLSVGGHDFLGATLATCRRPIYYFCGEKDETYRQTAQQALSFLPDMAVRIFPNASHNISIQYPEEIARAIYEILI